MSQSDDSPLASIRALPDKWRKEADDAALRGYLEAWNQQHADATELEAALAALAAPIPPDSTPSGAIEVQPGLYVAHQSTSIFHQDGSPSEAPDNQKIKK